MQGIYAQPLSKLATGTILRNGLMLGYAQVHAADMEKYIRILAGVIYAHSANGASAATEIISP